MDHHDATSLESLKGLFARLETEFTSLTEDDDVGVSREQFLEVTGLNPRVMVSSRLAPVPRSTSARPQFHVPEPTQIVNFDLASCGRPRLAIVQSRSRSEVTPGPCW
jgi:hypothetical protein